MTGDMSEGWILEDNECGEFAIAGEADIEKIVAIHFALVHDRTGIIIEGVDFRRLPLVLRCDLCGTIAELPWWEHVANPPIGEIDDDGRWLACDPCHELLVRRDTHALVDRAWANAQETSPGMVRSPAGSGLKLSLTIQMRAVVKYLDGGRREEL